MVESTTVTYRGEQCGHTERIEFIGRDSWDTKTRGCSSCGMTQLFTEVNEDESEIIVGEDESGDDTPTEDELIANSDAMDESTIQSLEDDVGRADDALSVLEYKELQSVASKFDDVSGSGRSFEDIKYDLVGKQTVFDAIEDVTDTHVGELIEQRTEDDNSEENNE